MKNFSQMMDFFGEEEWGNRILDTIKNILLETENLTLDLGGSASTSEVEDRFVKLLVKNAQKEESIK